MPDSPENMLKNILNDPEAMNKISGIISAIGNENDSPSTAAAMPDNAELLMKMSEIMSKVSESDDNGVNLITALKPYLSPQRAKSADKAIKLLKLTRIGSMLGDTDLL